MQKIKPYLFIAPALIVFLVFSIYPILSMIQLSFFDWDLVSVNKTFVGIQNYLDLFKDKMFWQTISNTFVYMILTVLLGVGFGILLALFLQKNTKINAFMQSIIFSPYIISLASVSFVWIWLMNKDYGLINYVL